MQPSRGNHRVLHREYPDAFDLTGKDLFSLLDHPKAEVAALIGGMVAKKSMSAVALPVESVTTMTGEIADEIHEWPNVTLGPRFRHLVLHFMDDRLVGFRWSFPTLAGSRSNITAMVPPPDWTIVGRTRS